MGKIGVQAEEQVKSEQFCISIENFMLCSF